MLMEESKVVPIFYWGRQTTIRESHTWFPGVATVRDAVQIQAQNSVSDPRLWIVFVPGKKPSLVGFMDK